jgi:hypothetical protein
LHLNFTGAQTHEKHFFCFLSSPWCESENKTLKYQKNGMIFSKALLDSLVGREETDFEKVTLSKFQAKMSDEMRLIDKKVVEIKLNGYKTLDPFNKHADSVELGVFLGLTSKRITKDFEMVIQDAFHTTETIKFNTFLLASSIVLNDIVESEDFTTIDATGKVTEVAVINDGLISEIISMPLALKGFIKRISDKFATSTAEAISIIKMYCDGSLSLKLRENIFQEIEAYGQDFVDTLKKLSAFPPSRKIFFFTEPEFRPIVKEWSKKINGADPIFVNSNFFKAKLAGNTDIDGFLSIETLFINKLYNLQ